MAGKQPRPLSTAARQAEERLGRLCSAFPDAERTWSFGNPAWKAGGKLFAVLDRYAGRDCLWLRIPPFMRGELLREPGWFASPYDPRKQALCVDLEAIDWRSIRPLIRLSRLQVVAPSVSDGSRKSGRRTPPSRSTRSRSARP